MATDQEKLDKLTARAAERAAADSAGLNQKVASLRSQIEKLLHERSGIELGLLTVEETVKLAKQKLREGRRDFFFTEFLTQHMKDTQMQQTAFLDPTVIKLHFTADRNLYKWLYGIVTELDIDEAAKALAPGGLSEKQKKEKIDSLNKRIKELENEIETLLS
jgi:hypothetical protein